MQIVSFVDTWALHTSIVADSVQNRQTTPPCHNRTYSFGTGAINQEPRTLQQLLFFPVEFLLEAFLGFWGGLADKRTISCALSLLAPLVFLRPCSQVDTSNTSTL